MKDKMFEVLLCWYRLTFTFMMNQELVSNHYGWSPNFASNIKRI